MICYASLVGCPRYVWLVRRFFKKGKLAIRGKSQLLIKLIDFL